MKFVETEAASLLENFWSHPLILKLESGTLSILWYLLAFTGHLLCGKSYAIHVVHLCNSQNNPEGLV